MKNRLKVSDRLNGTGKRLEFVSFDIEFDQVSSGTPENGINCGTYYIQAFILPMNASPFALIDVRNPASVRYQCVDTGDPCDLFSVITQPAVIPRIGFNCYDPRNGREDLSVFRCCISGKIGSI